MPNTRGGKNFKKSKSNRVRVQNEQEKADLDAGDFYATVKKMLGGTRIEVQLHNGTLSQVSIPGKFRRRCWFKTGDTVLVNSDMEIVKKISNTDVDAVKASDLMEQFDNEESDVVFGEEKETIQDEKLDIGKLKANKIINDGKINQARETKFNIDEI
jgi:initiation factor 1A